MILHLLAYVLIAMPLLNAFFVLDSWLLYRDDPEHSPILLALLWTTAIVWIVGFLFSVFSVRYLLDIEPIFPFDGVALAAALLIINLLPASIYFAIRRYERR